MSRFSPRLLIPLLAAALAWSPLGVPAATRDSTSKALDAANRRAGRDPASRADRGIAGTQHAQPGCRVGATNEA